MRRLKIGITGGIGSGKSIISKVFEGLGIPVFNADNVAKELMQRDVALKSALVKTFGPSTYNDHGELQRAYLAERVFSDPEQLRKLNAIVHPAAIQAAIEWAEKQTTPYSLKEAALLFESGSYRDLDATILVTAPLPLRISRVMQRDGLSHEQVFERVQRQWSDEQKLPLAQYIIYNDDLQPVLPQVWNIHQQLLQIAQNA